MKCIECGNVMVSRRENRRYTAGGLPQVVLLGVEVRRCAECGAEEMAIPRIEQLHRVIAQALLHKPARLAGPEVRFLRKYLGLSTTDFASRMGTARETVSRWERAILPIGPQADRLLRLLVARTAPVKDYSSEDLSRIQNPRTKPTPARLNLAVSSKGWQQVRAA